MGGKREYVWAERERERVYECTERECVGEKCVGREWEWRAGVYWERMYKGRESVRERECVEGKECGERVDGRASVYEGKECERERVCEGVCVSVCVCVCVLEGEIVCERESKSVCGRGGECERKREYVWKERERKRENMCGGGGLCACACVNKRCLKKYRVKTVFLRAEINNVGNVDFLQNCPFGSLQQVFYW